MDTELPEQSACKPPYQVGGVRFLNARPLLFGLDAHEKVRLSEAPPSHLADGLDDGSLQAALVPSIDYQIARRNWRVLPGMAIGSLGEVLTVRVFSRVPPGRIETLACDPDSHTSVFLAQLIWRMRYQRSLRITCLNEALTDHTAVLLIGDKVVEQLGRWPYEVDLGQAWSEEVNLPFVYAFWAVPDGASADELAEILTQAYQAGVAHIDDIARRDAGRYGFTEEQARKYFTEHLHFAFGQKEMNGVSTFYQLCEKHGLIPHWKKLNLYSMPQASQV